MWPSRPAKDARTGRRLVSDAIGFSGRLQPYDYFFVPMSPVVALPPPLLWELLIPLDPLIPLELVDPLMPLPRVRPAGFG